MTYTINKTKKTFSLIELIVVIIILSTILAVSTPKLAIFYRGIKLNQTARQIMIYLNSAKDVAIFEKRLCQVDLDSRWQNFQLKKQEDPINEPDKFAFIGGRQGKYQLTHDISISKIIKNGNTVNAGSEFKIEIHPIMSKDEYTFILQDSQNNEMEIKIEAGSGAARIVE